MILDLFPQPLDMHIHSPGIADILIPPDLIQKLLPGEHLVRGSRQEIEELQLLGRHFHLASVADHGIIGQVDGQPVVFHTLCLIGGGSLLSGRLAAPQDGPDPGHHFLGIKRLHDVVVGPQLQPQNLVKDLALGGKHDHRGGGFRADLPAHLVAVHARKHQVQQDQVGLVALKGIQRILPVEHNLRVKAFLIQVKRDQLRNILIIVYN